MPYYSYQHPVTEEVAEIFQHMDEPHEFFDQNGLQWARIFTNPTASIDTRIDPNSPQDFIDKTKKKNYSVGALWDTSAELSAKREKTFGKDSLKERAQESYKKKTGKEHPHAIKERAAKLFQY